MRTDREVISHVNDLALLCSLGYSGYDLHTPESE